MEHFFTERKKWTRNGSRVEPFWLHFVFSVIVMSLWIEANLHKLHKLDITFHFLPEYIYTMNVGSEVDFPWLSYRGHSLPNNELKAFSLSLLLTQVPQSAVRMSAF